MVAQYGGESHDVAWVFCKPMYRIQISIGIKFNTLLPVTSVLDTGVGLNLVNADLFPPFQK